MNLSFFKKTTMIESDRSVRIRAFKAVLCIYAAFAAMPYIVDMNHQYHHNKFISKKFEYDELDYIENVTYRPHTDDDELRGKFGPEQNNFNRFYRDDKEILVLKNHGEYPKIDISSRYGKFYMTKDKKFISDSEIKLYKMRMKDHDKNKKWIE